MFTYLLTLLGYLAILLLISRVTGRGATNDSFYRAQRRAPWYMVAFGMVGASISGVTFVSVPGMVTSIEMTYLQTCLGFIVGYAVVALVLLPIYYRMNLTTIYSVLAKRIGRHAYKTGASFFLLSKLTGAVIRFYVVCMLLQRFVADRWGVPFAVTVALLTALIWLYTRRGGIKTLVWTDSFQTLCLFTALLIIIFKAVTLLGLSLPEAVEAIAADSRSRVFVFDDWFSRQNFWKQFLSGIFIVIVMTGLDQDMMQKNLTCKTLRDAQKDMCTYGVAFVPANLLFLSLGILLAMLGERVEGYESLAGLGGDALLPAFVELGGTAVLVPFTIGIVAASFSSADSALTALTTSFCIDLLEREDDERLRRRVHVGVSLLFMAMILLFRAVGSDSVIDAIYVLCGYTYGPLLGLFAFALMPRSKARHLWQNDSRWVPVICLVSPLLCYLLDHAAQSQFGYSFGYELLMLNGLLTFIGLCCISLSHKVAH